MSQFQNSTQVQSVQIVTVFMRQVYAWMTLGLLATATTAWYVANDFALQQMIFGNTVILIGLCIAVFALPFVLTGMMARLSAMAATGLFLLYSSLMGILLSSVLLMYTSESIMSTFITTAGMFGAMSVYGTVTKRDLTSMGSFLTMGLIGVCIAMIVNIFLQNTMLEFIISILGVIVFTGLTAYDTQKIREFGEAAPLDDPSAMRRGALLGALKLYLDFINLFLMLLRLMGDRR